MFFLFVFLNLLLLLLTLKISIEIENIEINIKEPKLIQTENDKPLSVNDNYMVKIKFKVLNLLTVFKITITKQKFEKISSKKRFENMSTQLKDITKNTGIQEIKAIINELNIKIIEFYLNIDIGLDSIMLLVYIIPTVCTLISTLLLTQKVDKRKQTYEVKPVYNQRKFNKCQV